MVARPKPLRCRGGSPAINAGNESVCSTTTGTAPVANLDQRGYVRPGTGATSCSIGAFEANSVAAPNTPTPTVTPTPTITQTPSVTPTRTLIPTFTATPTPVPNLRQLTFGYAFPQNPRITDDGGLVVYDDYTNVRFASVDGSRAGPLTNVTSGFCQQPYPSANGDQVVMACTANITGQNPDGNSEIVLLNGPSLTFVTNSFYPSWNADPSLSADGRTVAFSLNATGSSEIFLWRNGQIARITPSGENGDKPLISGDGHRILFDRSSMVSLYDDQAGESLVARSIAGAAQLTRDGQTAVFRAPTLVLGSNGGSTMQLYAQPIGGPLQQLTNVVDRSSLSEFAANADGSRIAAVFSNRQIGEGALLTPAGPRVLPGVPPDAWSLSFDAAGRKLAFISWENLTNQNPYHLPQLFVADIPLDPPAPTPTPTPHPAPTTGTCTGDCNSNGQVTVDEILTMVNIALGNTAVTNCTAGDANADHQITVDEILTAVNSALNGCVAQGGTIEQGLAALAAGDLHSATQQFCAVAASAPAGDRSNLYCAASRVFTKVFDDPHLQSLALGSGVSLFGNSHDVCNWHAIIPHLPPSGSPSTGQIIAGLRDYLLPEIDAAAAQLEGLPDTVNVLFNLGNLPSCLTGRLGARDIEIDHGDVLALTAGLKFVHAAIDALGAYNVDFNPHDVVEKTAQDLLAGDATLGTLTSTGRLASARQFADAGLADAVNAINSILGETDDQSNDLVVIAPLDRDGAARTAQVLSLVRQALQQQVVFSTDVGLKQPARLDLSKLFNGQFASLRPLLPAFNTRGQFDLAHFLDPTFGGMAPDLTQEVITRFLLGDNCLYYVSSATTQANYDAAAAQRSCSGVYFYSGSGYSLCDVWGCLCGWSG
jgi:WD40-like Beta Propeller Repeat